MFQGIDGLNGSNQQPWGAVITIGEKGPSGAPTNTDRFFIKKAQAETAEFRGRSALVRKNHPDFVKFNTLDDLRWRQTIRFNLVHSVHLRDGWGSVEACFQFQLKAQTLPRIKGHPKRVPTCTGDGIRAPPPVVRVPARPVAILQAGIKVCFPTPLARRVEPSHPAGEVHHP